MQHLCAAFGRHRRSGKGPQLLVLMYHRILPHNDSRSLLEESGMTVTPETFRLHLEILNQHFSFVKLSEWTRLKTANKELPEKACAITFDDGWADNYEFAFPILKEKGVPATIFLVSDMTGTNAMFWPERLAHLVTNVSAHLPQYWGHPALRWLMENRASYRFSETPPTRDELSEQIASMKDYSDHEMHQKLDQVINTLNIQEVSDRPSLLDWDQVREMVNSGTVEVGSHTCHHIRLNQQVSGEILRKEIQKSKLVIEKHTGQVVDLFCYPNGDYSKAALKLVRESYDSAVTTQPGWNSDTSDQYQMKRIAVHEDITGDKTAFLARISGWM